jgi:L-seryl-tRNA(Ser) seleniumtransferase
VHRSNFRIVGFTESPALPDLVRLAHANGLWAIDDIGSGALRSGILPHADDDPTVADGIAAGADVVLFSGDKLLGGPQCGIIAGTRKAIDRIEADPLMRALRLDKMTLAALEATLRLVLDPERAVARIPLWSMIWAPVSVLSERAASLAGSLSVDPGYHAAVVSAESYLGGGSAPIQPIPTAAIAISPPFPAPFTSEAALAKALRLGDPPVIVRVQKGVVLLDMRTVSPDCDAHLLDALRKVCHDRRSEGRRNGLVDAGGARP